MNAWRRRRVPARRVSQRENEETAAAFVLLAVIGEEGSGNVPAARRTVTPSVNGGVPSRANSCSRPLRPRVGRRCSAAPCPVGGENADHLKMEACLIFKSPLKVIFKPSAENAKTQGKRPFSDLQGHFRVHEAVAQPL